MNKRIEALKKQLPKEVDGVSINAFLVTSEVNCRYLSNFPSSSRFMLITHEESYFLTDFRYQEAAKNDVQGSTVVIYETPMSSLKELLYQHNVTGILLEQEQVTLSKAKAFQKIFDELNIQLVNQPILDELLTGMRAIKTPDEIGKIKAAQEITDDAFSYILQVLKIGKTETEIALEIEMFMRKQGAEKIAFDLIVVSGENGSLCHGVPSSKKIEHGDFVTMDIGAVVDGYHSDMTRTVAMGAVSGKRQDVYQTVLTAQNNAIEAAKPNIACNIVDKVARDVIQAKYPNTFGHGTGHAVGLEIHEWPYFSPNCKVITKPGMVITVEPGIYLEGEFGVRIEDMVLITANGCENLTKSKKELIIL